jgi:Transposase
VIEPGRPEVQSAAVEVRGDFESLGVATAAGAFLNRGDLRVQCDLEQATVEYIERDRRRASLQAYFDGFESGALEVVQAVSMDMWPPYINACLEKIPGARGKTSPAGGCVACVSPTCQPCISNGY